MKVRNKYTISSVRRNECVVDFIAGNVYEAKIDANFYLGCYVVTNEREEQNIFSKDYFHRMFEVIED